MKEKVSQFWDNQPCNLRHSDEPIGTRKYFEEVEKKKYFVEPHIPGFAGFEKWQGKKVLEIGPGMGTDGINFIRAGARYTGVELSRASLALFMQRLEVLGLSGTLHHGDAENLSSVIPAEPYDLIYSFGVIHHSPLPGKIIQEIKKFCSEETEVRIMVYATWSWKVLWIILTYGRGAFWRARTLIPKYSEAQTGCPVTYTYASRTVKQLMGDFEIIEIRKAHIFPYVISEYVQRRYRMVWYFKYLPRSVFKWLERRLGWHLLVVAKLKQRS